MNNINSPTSRGASDEANVSYDESTDEADATQGKNNDTSDPALQETANKSGSAQAKITANPELAHKEITKKVITPQAEIGVNSNHPSRKSTVTAERSRKKHTGKTDPIPNRNTDNPDPTQRQHTDSEDNSEGENTDSEDGSQGENTEHEDETTPMDMSDEPTPTRQEKKDDAESASQSNKDASESDTSRGTANNRKRKAHDEDSSILCHGTPEQVGEESGDYKVPLVPERYLIRERFSDMAARIRRNEEIWANANVSERKDVQPHVCVKVGKVMYSEFQRTIDGVEAAAMMTTIDHAQGVEAVQPVYSWKVKHNKFVVVSDLTFLAAALNYQKETRESQYLTIVLLNSSSRDVPSSSDLANSSSLTPSLRGTLGTPKCLSLTHSLASFACWRNVSKNHRPLGRRSKPLMLCISWVYHKRIVTKK